MEKYMIDEAVDIIYVICFYICCRVIMNRYSANTDYSRALLKVLLTAILWFAFIAGLHSIILVK